MKIWVDTDSGTFGQDDGSLLIIELDADEVKFFGELSDSERIEVTQIMHKTCATREDFDVWSAHAAVVSIQMDRQQEQNQAGGK